MNILTVKVTGAKYDSRWYADMIGVCFQVVEDDAARFEVVIVSADYSKVKRMMHWIDRGDCDAVAVTTIL